MKNWIPLSIFTIFFLMACGGGFGLRDSTKVDDSNSIDITNQTLTSTDPDCRSYAGSYRSMIHDDASDQDFSGSLVISVEGNSCTFQTNQIPNHDTGKNSHFATDIDEVDATLDIPIDPQLQANKTELGFGANAILLNGIKWEAYPAACFDVGNSDLGLEAIGCDRGNLDHPWRYNIGSTLNEFGFDEYFAHVQPTGLYHYHSSPSVLFEPNCEGAQVSPVIGFAADGFPVYGPCFQAADGTVRFATSSYQIKDGIRQDVEGYLTPYAIGNVKSDYYDGQFINDHEFISGSGDLDECNGMTVNGQYGYYVTQNYPYVLACFSGQASNNFR